MDRIPRISKSRCPAVAACNDYMRASGSCPSEAQVGAWISAVNAKSQEPTPENFRDFLLVNP